MKPWYRKEWFSDADTARLVDGRWSHYFPAGKCEMGDSERGHVE